jgi:hypothetical protein
MGMAKAGSSSGKSHFVYIIGLTGTKIRVNSFLIILFAPFTEFFCSAEGIILALPSLDPHTTSTHAVVVVRSVMAEGLKSQDQSACASSGA